MKTVTGLIFVLMIMVLVSGCQQTTEDLSIGNMKLNIPSDWQRHRESDSLQETAIDNMEFEGKQYFSMDVYEVPSRKDILLFLTDIEMNKVYEEMDEIWRGWDHVFTNGHLKESWTNFYTAVFLDAISVDNNFAELIQKQNLHHTLHDCEALERIVTYEIDNELFISNILLVFAKNDLGILVFRVEKSTYEEYEDTWDEIRNSVRF